MSGHGAETVWRSGACALRPLRSAVGILQESRYYRVFLLREMWKMKRDIPDVTHHVHAHVRPRITFAPVTTVSSQCSLHIKVGLPYLDVRCWQRRHVFGGQWFGTITVQHHYGATSTHQRQERGRTITSRTIPWDIDRHSRQGRCRQATQAFRIQVGVGVGSDEREPA